MDNSKLVHPKIVIKKGTRSLEVFDGDRFIKAYRVALGFAPDDCKEIEGDGKTPEGRFFVFIKNAESKFHLSLGLSYPGAEDAKRGLDSGLITREEYDEIIEALAEKRMPLQKTTLGGEIYIHGGGTEGDWTEGCVALADKEIEELFELIPVGTEVEIK